MEDIQKLQEEDVTELFMNFREGARHLWNCCMVNDSDWEVRDYFSRICQILFTAVVLYPLDRMDLELPTEGEGNPEPFSCFELHWRAKTEMPIVINRATPRSNEWGDPINKIPMDGARLLFIRFFDWDHLGKRDFFYYQVLIKRLPAYPYLEGRVALVTVDRLVSIIYRPAEKKLVQGTS